MDHEITQRRLEALGRIRTLALERAFRQRPDLFGPWLKSCVSEDVLLALAPPLPSLAQIHQEQARRRAQKG